MRSLCRLARVGRKSSRKSGRHVDFLPDLAQKREDGSWTLLPDSLDLPRQTDNFEAIRMGRVFLAEYDGAGRMFEPVWQDREQ